MNQASTKISEGVLLAPPFLFFFVAEDVSAVSQKEHDEKLKLVSRLKK
jgi:hypothetical protein